MYPVLIKRCNQDYLVYVPDIDQFTEGKSFSDAIYMARDLLGTCSLSGPLPDPSTSQEAVAVAEQKADNDEFKWSDGVLTFVDIDEEEYRKQTEDKIL